MMSIAVRSEVCWEASSSQARCCSVDWCPAYSPVWELLELFQALSVSVKFPVLDSSESFPASYPGPELRFPVLVLPCPEWDSTCPAWLFPESAPSLALSVPECPSVQFQSVLSFLFVRTLSRRSARLLRRILKPQLLLSPPRSAKLPRRTLRHCGVRELSARSEKRKAKV